ncbi:hypothetical protein HG531_014110 [Fusarium graminearum]|nr:hypothetical protein HG531_014110 [Fusarium graminearum]
MGNEHWRRLSKRLAATGATDYEHDAGFAFVRESKRIKTDKTDEPKPEAVPKPKAEPVKKSTKGRPAAKRRAAQAPTTNGTIVEEEPPEKETHATTKPTTRKSSRQKASVDASVEREINVPKRPSTRMSTRRSGEGQEKEALQPAPASISEPEPEAAPTSHVNAAPKKRGSRAKPSRPPPDWDKSPQRKPPVQSATIALPMSDTPIINRNKEMQKKGGNKNKRSSLGNRGRRASSLIESGQTAIPHRDVNPTDFYKHIEAEGLIEPRHLNEGKIRGFLADETVSFDAIRSQTESRLRTIQSLLEFQVDQLADNVHKLEQQVLVAAKEADKVLSASALRLRQRDKREKASARTKDMPVIEVLRSLGNILSEGGG